MKKSISITLMATLLFTVSLTAQKRNQRKEPLTGQEKIIRTEKSAREQDTAGYHDPMVKGSGLTSATENQPNKLDATPATIGFPPKTNQDNNFSRNVNRRTGAP